MFQKIFHYLVDVFKKPINVLLYCLLYTFIYRIALFHTQTLETSYLYIVRDFLCGMVLDLSLLLFIINGLYLKYIRTFSFIFSILYISINISHLALSVQYKAGLANFSYLIEYANEFIPLLKTGSSLVPIWYILVFWILPISIFTNLYKSINKNFVQVNFVLPNILFINNLPYTIKLKLESILKYISKYSLQYSLTGLLLFLLGFGFMNAFYNNPLADNSTNSHANNSLYRMIQSQYRSWQEENFFHNQEASQFKYPDKKHFEQMGYSFEKKDYPLIKVPKTEDFVPKYKPNIVIIVMESVAAKDTGFKKYLSIQGKDVTPFINSLINKSIIVPKFFSNADYTAGAETAIFCSTHDSLRYFMGSGSILRNNTYLRLKCLPKILSDIGYSTFFFHSYTATFDNKHIFFPLNGIQEIIDQDHDVFKHSPKTYWGIQDKEMFEYGVKHISNRIQEQKQRNQDKPFFTFFLTVNNHPPYILHNKALKKRYVSNEMYNNYLNTVNQTDTAIKIFFEHASKEAWYNNTIFIITSDNGSIQSNTNQKNQNTIKNFKMLHTVPFIIYSPQHKFGIKPSVLDIAGASHIDITPTILDILNLNIKNHFAGESLLKPNRKNHSFIYDWFNNYYRISWPLYYNLHDNKVANLETEKEFKVRKRKLYELKSWTEQTSQLFNYVVFKNKLWND